MSVNQRFGYAFGAVYVLVGLLGFTVTGGVGFASSDGGMLLGLFEVNPLHNVVHLLVGAALIGGATRSAWSPMVNTAVGAVYLMVFVVGLVIPETLNLLALNAADNLLHLASGGLALGVGLSGLRQTPRPTTRSVGV